MKKTDLIACHVFMLCSSVLFGAEFNALRSSQLVSGTLSIKGRSYADVSFALQDLGEEGNKQGACALVVRGAAFNDFESCMHMCVGHIDGLGPDEKLDDYSDVFAAEMEYHFPKASALLMAVLHGKFVCVKRIDETQYVISGHASDDHEERFAEGDNRPFLSWKSNQ